MGIRLTLMSFGIAVLFTGCDTGVNRPTTQPGDRKVPPAEDTNTAQESKSKQEFEHKLDDDLKEIDRKMAQLAQRINEAEGEAKARLKQEWDDLKPQRERAKERLEELKKSSAAAWEDLKAGAQSAFVDLRESVNRASARFDQKETKQNEK